MDLFLKYRGYQEIFRTLSMSQEGVPAWLAGRLTFYLLKKTEYDYSTKESSEILAGTFLLPVQG